MKTSCIYFLFRKGELIYIGQTVDLVLRLRGHQWFDVDMVRFIPCEPAKLKHYEARLIRFFRPKCNHHHNPNPAERMPLRKKLKRNRKYKYEFINKKILIKT